MKMENPKFKVGDTVLLEGQIKRVFTDDVSQGWCYHINIEGEKFISPVLPLPGIDVHERGLKSSPTQEGKNE